MSPQFTNAEYECRSLKIAGFAILWSLLLTGCSDAPADPATCPMGGTTGPACEPAASEGGEPPPSECADPEFSASAGPGTQYVCEGQAGGAIVYNQVEITVNGETKAGPGSVPSETLVQDFPGDADVEVCCSDPGDGGLSADELADACESDCARAACNRVLDDLRSQLMESDPSDGACDGLVFDNLVDGCRGRIAESLEHWIGQIEANYDDCLAAARWNSDPMLAYTDISVAFNENGKVELGSPPCFNSSNPEDSAVGCLYEAQLRPFCTVDDHKAGMTCSAAGNLEDANADGGADTTGGSGSGSDPFGDIDALVTCTSTSSTTTSCTLDQQLIENVISNSHVFWEDGVEVTLVRSAPEDGLLVTGLDAGETSKELTDAFGSLEGNAIYSVNGVVLDSWDDVWDAAESAEDLTSWTVVVEACGVLCSTHTYSITLGTPAVADEPLGLTPGAGADGGEAAETTTSGCGCRSGDSDGRGTPAVLLLFGLLVRGRRRRRAVPLA